MRLACSGLSGWFKERATIVTPTPFLASVAADQFANEQLAEGAAGWSRPAIHSIDAWLVTCWQQVRYALKSPASLLSPAQERALWQQIIERENQGLFDTNTAARLASDAQRLMAEWQIPSDGEIWMQQQDARQFQNWRSVFRRRCAEEGWITRGDLWAYVPKWLAEGILTPTRTVLLGFDQPHPALRNVIEALGNEAVLLPFSGSVPKAVPAAAFNGMAEELEYAARWARAAYQNGKARSIGVAVPDLRSQHGQVERVFQHVFYPSRLRIPGPAGMEGVTHEESVFHLGASRALANEPLVANALLMLELAQPRIHHSHASTILRSPYLAAASEERDLRAQADFGLRRKRELDFSLRDLEYASRDCPALSRLWPKVRDVLRSAAKPRQELGEWTRFIAEFLGALGWPGDRELNTIEQKAFESWEEALSRLAALGLVIGTASLEEALGQLARILARSGMETGDLSSPVQVLDAAETHGIEFDSAVVVGMSDETWPPPVRLSPLVPLTLQRARGVPGSTPAGAKRERERATKHVLAVAREMTVTFSGRISPLAEPFVEREGTARQKVWGNVLPRKTFPAALIEELEDTYAPSFEQSETTRGGTSIIKSQSQCPFRALAEFRLHARGPDEASFGLDARERGGYLHKALQNVWTELKTQERLLKMPDQELRSLVQTAICEAVKTNENSGPLHVLVSSAERARLEEVILEWLVRVERYRKTPFAVESMELERAIELNGLRLRLRVDRVDRLRDGSILLFDYKSGAQSKKKLDGPRPQEPQLLLYASAMESVDGIFFGELRARNTRAVGYSRSKYFAGASTTALKDWDDFLARSEAEVAGLAEQFVKGYAAVDPLKNACGFCGLDALCRVNERVREAEDDEG